MCVCINQNNVVIFIIVYIMYRNDMNEPSVFNGPEVR